MVDRKANPTDAKTYYQMGNDYYEKGDYDKAIENYNMAILLNPVFSEAYFNRALSYYQLKNFDKSIADYTKSMELDPQNPIIFNNRGDAFYRKQDFQSAIKDYDKAITLNPNYLKAFYNRGLSYASVEEYEKAVEDFSKVIKLKADFAEAYHLRGLAFEYAGNMSNAIVDYEKALSLNPELTEAKTHLDSAKAKKDQEGKEGGKEGGTADIKMLSKPTMTFNDVAGMTKMKEEIREAVVYPMRNPDLARKYGKLGGGGILMYGPPGCGKTFIVKSAAGECSSGFINAKLSDLLDMYVGNTEKNIHKVFELARKNSPVILFFDEVEAIGGRRDAQEGAQYMKMAVNQMLYEMDGVEANNSNVLIIAATNAPWDVDPALRRSGRFSKTIFIPAPDYESRVAMLKMYAKKRPLAPFIPFWLLGITTTGYASADMKAIVDDAATIPWRQAFMGIEKRIIELTKGGMEKAQAEEIAKKQVSQRSVTLGDFVMALAKKRSSLPPWYEQAKKQIGKQEEITMVDGKEHKKVTDSKMGPGEKEAFKDLLGIINNRSQWHYKAYLMLTKETSLMVLRIIVFVTEGARIS
jgi:transitional endoplasmic reticulum ATPase